MKTEIVLSPLHDHGIGPEAGGTFKKGQVLEVDLFLKIFRSGRDDRLFPAQDDGNKITECLSGTCPAFYHGWEFFLEAVPYQKGHLDLGGAKLETLEGTGQLSLLAKDFLDGDGGG